MALSDNAVKRLMISLADAGAGREVADALDTAVSDLPSATPGVSNVGVAALIVATATSQTTDFAALKVGDAVLHTLVADGTSVWLAAIATAGTLGTAAVVGDTYLVLRNFKVPAAHTTTL